MIGTTMRRWVGASLFVLATGCGALDVSDPTAVEDGELNNAGGAELLRLNAMAKFYEAVSTTGIYSGLLSDELFADPPYYYVIYGYVSVDEMVDRRESLRIEQVGGGATYFLMQQLRYATSLAMPKIRAYMLEGARESRLAEMFAVRGYAALTMGEQVCPGFPLHNVVDYKAVLENPLTMDQVYDRALADLDSALMYAPADSGRLVNFARVSRGRALLAAGRFDEAAAAVADVPDDYLGQAKYEGGDISVNLFMIPPRYNFTTWAMSDNEGGNGLDFVSANDPRLARDSVAVAVDESTVMYVARKYATQDKPITYASGIEARLIEAEVALSHDDPSWITKLNHLRNERIVPAMGDLPMPTTALAKLDLLFRERAFWLWGTGHRLGDIRRLIGHYGRDAEDLYPKGPYRLGGTYGTGTNLPFAPAGEQAYNPAVTGCTAR